MEKGQTVRAFLFGAMVLFPVVGCASSPDNGANKAQTTAAAGLAVSTAAERQNCAYDTSDGRVSVTVATTDACPPLPPAPAIPAPAKTPD